MEELSNKNNQEIEKPSEKQEKQETKKRREKKHALKWPFIVLIITLILSFIFSFGSEFLLSDAGIVVSIILLVFFLGFAMISDMIGVAVTAADIASFNAMSAKKVRGAKEGIMLIHNVDKVASIFCDVTGDICGILSGAIGAALTIQIIGAEVNGIKAVLIASLVSALVAALTVFLKSLGKRIAIKNADKIILIVGKIINFFKFGK